MTISGTYGASMISCTTWPHSSISIPEVQIGSSWLKGPISRRHLKPPTSSMWTSWRKTWLNFTSKMPLNLAFRHTRSRKTAFLKHSKRRLPQSWRRLGLAPRTKWSLCKTAWWPCFWAVCYSGHGSTPPFWKSFPVFSLPSNLSEHTIFSIWRTIGENTILIWACCPHTSGKLRIPSATICTRIL